MDGACLLHGPSATMVSRSPASVCGFAPVAGAHAEVLIVGSMPGTRSLTDNQYYAHPRNAFWPIAEALFHVPANAGYQQRCAALTAAGGALWDVLAQCDRDGSLDTSISSDSAMINDFQSFFAEYSKIKRVLCNGAYAYKAYCKHVTPTLSAEFAALPVLKVPSTSPAYASMRVADKLAAWRAALIA